VRTFGTFTSGVEAVCAWLLECGITTAAMESTGNYWITLYDTLARAGIEVYLVNARHVKGVPGKKTDVCDARWLQQLHAAGLLRKSFRPAPGIVPLRFLMRHRGEMGAECSRQLHLMQKTLTEMNLKLHHVFSDIDGTSAQAIIGAILAGERDAAKLAALRDRRCRSSLADIMEALRGDYREEYLFVLRQSVETWKHLRESIARCDEKLGALAAAVECGVAAGPPPAALRACRPAKNSPGFGVLETAWRFYGVNLAAVPGISAGLLAALVSEVGTREQMLASFRGPEAFASWLGLCPDNRISGGKVLKSKTRKVKCRLALALRLGVFGLQKSESRMGAYLRRMKGKLGKAEGTTAAAHKLARIIYGMIKSGREWDEKEAFQLTPQGEARRRKALEKQAAALGLTLQPAA
jgi:transposase